MKMEESGEVSDRAEPEGVVSWPVWLDCFRLVCFGVRKVGVALPAIRSSLNLFE